nr:hypothetical protein [Tanacetum cinerariifolium]
MKQEELKDIDGDTYEPRPAGFARSLDALLAKEFLEAVRDMIFRDVHLFHGTINTAVYSFLVLFGFEFLLLVIVSNALVVRYQTKETLVLLGLSDMKNEVSTAMLLLIFSIARVLNTCSICPMLDN